jgi:hypothetical protein
MPYNFNFNLTRLSRSLFEEIVKVSSERGLHRRVCQKATYLVEKLKIPEVTGLPISDALTLVRDLIDVHAENLRQREKFLQTNKRVLFLPHCARKHMDARCRAFFDREMSSYRCRNCSSDCLINQAASLATEIGYDVYIVPGGSCIPRILHKMRYEGVVGVACCEEMKLALNYLKSANIACQGVPLTKNGCSNTEFNLESLKKVLTASSAVVAVQ